VLSTVRTDETHSFDPPPDAVVCDDWLTFGAARDWFTLPLGCWALGSWLGGKVSVNSCGLVETLPGLTNGWIAPLAADLGIVPEANWQQILHFTPYTLHSLFWHCLTPSNTLQMTWMNALLDRAATTPESRERIMGHAAGLLADLRAAQSRGWVNQFLQEYRLNSSEGAALLSLR
jgi:hypothetical protein